MNEKLPGPVEGQPQQQQEVMPTPGSPEWEVRFIKKRLELLDAVDKEEEAIQRERRGEISHQDFLNIGRGVLKIMNEMRELEATVPQGSFYEQSRDKAELEEKLLALRAHDVDATHETLMHQEISAEPIAEVVSHEAQKSVEAKQKINRSEHQEEPAPYFPVESKVVWKGEPGWMVLEVPSTGDLVEIGRMKRGMFGRMKLVKELVSTRELAAAPFSAEFQFTKDEPIVYRGESGWKVLEMPTYGNVVEIGKMEKIEKKGWFGRKKIVEQFVTKLVSLDEIKREASKEIVPEIAIESVFKAGDFVTWKGEPDWKIESVVGKDDNLLKISRRKRNAAGREMYVEEIVEAKDKKIARQ